MKLLVIGIGDCGCRLAGEFALLNKMAKAKRHVSIVTCAYAFNNDEANLAALTKTRREWLQPVLIRGSLEGEEKSAEAGAELMRQESDRVLAAMRPGGSVESDAFLFIAGAAGSLGSGGVPVVAQQLKQRYADKPVYVLIVLPFDSEIGEPQCVHNTAICLNSIGKIADAVILVDNGGLRGGGNIALNENMGSVNKEIVFPFYNLLCAGEMGGSGYAAAKVVDAGDIVQTLAGWTAIGVGEVRLPGSVFPWRKMGDFRKKGMETSAALEAMNAALARLSIDCRLEDAGKALYLLSAPPKQASIDMTKDLGNRLRELAYNAEIRGGNFYGAANLAQVTVVVSELIYMDRIKNYYDRAVGLAHVENKGE